MAVRDAEKSDASMPFRASCQASTADHEGTEQRGQMGNLGVNVHVRAFRAFSRQGAFATSLTVTPFVGTSLQGPRTEGTTRPLSDQPWQRPSFIQDPKR